MPRTALACLLLALAAPAVAEPLPIEPLFGNTLEMTYPDGGRAKLWVDPDGGYRGVSKYGQRSSGHWTIRGGKLCMRQSRPIPVPFPYCTPIVERSIGAAWPGRAVTGEKIWIRLVAGR